MLAINVTYTHIYTHTQLSTRQIDDKLKLTAPHHNFLNILLNHLLTVLNSKSQLGIIALQKLQHFKRIETLQLVVSLILHLSVPDISTLSSMTWSIFVPLP